MIKRIIQKILFEINRNLQEITKTIKINAFSKLPSKASFSEFNPKHNPIIVIKLGKATLKSIFFIYRLN